MKLKLYHSNPNNIKYRIDLDRPTIKENLEERNWKSVVENKDEEEYNFYWIAVTKLKGLFNPRYKIRLRND